jgi:hypothetical protein
VFSVNKCFSRTQVVAKFIHLSSLFVTIATFGYSNIAYADVGGIPYNPDFPKAEYPYAQAPDACSGVTDRPDSNGEIRDTWGPVDFRGACNTHDKCYYTVGSNWNTCNERFYSDLRAACERDLRTSTRVPAPTLRDPLRTRRVDLPPEPARLSACYTIASGYYAGVQAGVGIGVFRKAQDKQRRYEAWVASVRNPSSSCVSVDSKRGWQRFNLPGSFTRVASIGGAWSVDSRNYSPVGSSGHTGRDAEALTPYNQYKFDQRFPFGALLMGSGQGVLWIQNPVSFNGSLGAVDMRINDADNALGDNGGSLQVCFGK